MKQYVRILFVFLLFSSLPLFALPPTSENVNILPTSEPAVDQPKDPMMLAEQEEPKEEPSKANVVATNATGETQTTIVDQNGNLKMVPVQEAHPEASTQPSMPQAPINKKNMPSGMAGSQMMPPKGEGAMVQQSSRLPGTPSSAAPVNNMPQDSTGNVSSMQQAGGTADATRNAPIPTAPQNPLQP